tara:strand:+ start:202033 stop:202560 length:528 start_codon:yes stop_codon:yes gene_type:complete
MENQQQPARKKIMLNYGLLSGLILIVISLLTYATGNTYTPHWSINVISIVSMIVIIVLGIKKFKDLNGSFLSLGQSLKTGIGIALLSVIAFMIYLYVFANFIEPEFINRTTEINIQKALENNPSIPQETLDMQESMTKKYFFLFTFGFFLIFNLFIGFITSLIAGIVMKKVENEY